MAARQHLLEMHEAPLGLAIFCVAPKPRQPMPFLHVAQQAELDSIGPTQVIHLRGKHHPAQAFSARIVMQEIAQFVVAIGRRDEYHAIGRGDARQQQFRRAADVGQYRNCASLEHAKISDQPLRDIRHRDQHALTRLHAQSQQAIGESIRLFVQLAPAHTTAQIIDCRGFREAPRSCFQQARQRYRRRPDPVRRAAIVQLQPGPLGFQFLASSAPLGFLFGLGFRHLHGVALRLQKALDGAIDRIRPLDHHLMRGNRNHDLLRTRNQACHFLIGGIGKQIVALPEYHQTGHADRTQ